MLVILLAVSSIFAISVDGFVTDNSGLGPQTLACPGPEVDEACSSFCSKLNTSGFSYAAVATSKNQHALLCGCQVDGPNVEDERPSISSFFSVGAPEITTSPFAEQLCPLASPQLKTCEQFCPIFNQRPYCFQDINKPSPQKSFFICACY